MDISLLFPLLILLLFIPIFLSGRKQRRQMQETQAMQKELSNGDVVVTTSGLRGTVVDASYEETIDLEIADGVVTTWVRGAVRERVMSTGEPSTAPAPSAPDAVEAGAGPAEVPSLEKDVPAADGAAPSLEKTADAAGGAGEGGVEDRAGDRVEDRKDSTNGTPRA